jgi:hypothetical protein
VWLHASAILPVVWEQVPVEAIQKETGGAYAASLGTDWMMPPGPYGGSPAQLLEDGAPLPYPNSPVDAVSTLGGGRYSVSDGHVYFVPIDNSDPRSNGRRYAVKWPVRPPRWLRAAALTLAVGAGCWLLVVFRRTAWRLLTEPPFWCAAALFVIVTVATRLWFFLDMPVPGLYPDSGSYYALSKEIAAGDWPRFALRTPGYPLFLAAVFAISDTLMALLLAQNALMLFSGILLIYAFHAVRPWLANWVAMGLCVYTGGLWVLEHDTAMLSDSPYSYAIMLTFAFLILAIVRRRPVFFALASAAMAATILVRPAGVFFLVVFVLCLAFLLHNRFGRPQIVAFMVPLPALLLLLCTYNYATFGQFAMTAFGESQLAFATFTFWEEDPSYPPGVNDAIRRTQGVMQRQLDEQQRATLRSSWDFQQLAPLFLTGFHYPALTEASTIDGTDDYLAARHWIRRVSLDSIAKHRDLYAKFVATQLWLQFYNVTYQEDFLAFVQNRLVEIYGTTKYRPGRGDPFYVEMAKEYATARAPAEVRIEGEGARAHAVIRQMSAWRQLFAQWRLLRRDWFAHRFWVVWFFVALAGATIRLALTKGRHEGAFIAFVLCVSLLGASLVIALVEYGGHRYSYVIEYVYYLPVVALPFLRTGADGFHPTTGRPQPPRSVTA